MVCYLPGNHHSRVSSVVRNGVRPSAAGWVEGSSDPMILVQQECEASKKYQAIQIPPISQLAGACRAAGKKGMNLGIPEKEPIGDDLSGSFPHSLLSTIKARPLRQTLNRHTWPADTFSELLNTSCKHPVLDGLGKQFFKLKLIPGSGSNFLQSCKGNNV